MYNIAMGPTARKEFLSAIYQISQFGTSPFDNLVEKRANELHLSEIVGIYKIMNLLNLLGAGEITTNKERFRTNLLKPDNLKGLNGLIDSITKTKAFRTSPKS